MAVADRIRLPEFSPEGVMNTGNTLFTLDDGVAPHALGADVNDLGNAHRICGDTRGVGVVADRDLPNTPRQQRFV